MEFSQFLEGVLADHVRVQDEERGVVLGQNLLRELQRTSRAQRFGLDREFDLDIVLFLVLDGKQPTRSVLRSDVPAPVWREGEAYLFQGRHHDIRTVVNRQNNIGYTSSCQTLNLVQDHGPVGELDQGFRERESLSPLMAGQHLF